MGTFSKNWVDYTGDPMSKQWRGLSWSDIMQYKDRNGGGLTPGGGSGWPGRPSGVGDLLPFLLFAALSTMFWLLFPVTLDLTCSITLLRLVVCNEVNNFAAVGGPVSSSVCQKLGI